MRAFVSQIAINFRLVLELSGSCLKSISVTILTETIPGLCYKKDKNMPMWRPSRLPKKFEEYRYTQEAQGTTSIGGFLSSKEYYFKRKCI